MTNTYACVFVLVPKRLSADTHIVTVARLIFISMKIEMKMREKKKKQKGEALRDLTAIFSGHFSIRFL